MSEQRGAVKQTRSLLTMANFRSWPNPASLGWMRQCPELADTRLSGLLRPVSAVRPFADAAPADVSPQIPTRSRHNVLASRPSTAARL